MRRISDLGGTLGIVVIGLGFAAIGFGWYGMAGPGGRVNGVPDLRAQLPYLLSGGVLGLALVILGCVLVITEVLRADRELLLKHLRSHALGPAPQLGIETVSAPRHGDLVAHAGQYHRPSCATLSGLQHVDYVSAVVAAASGLTPCRVCRPDELAKVDVGSRSPQQGSGERMTE